MPAATRPELQTRLWCSALPCVGARACCRALERRLSTFLNSPQLSNRLMATNIHIAPCSPARARARSTCRRPEVFQHPPVLFGKAMTLCRQHELVTVAAPWPDVPCWAYLQAPRDEAGVRESRHDTSHTFSTSPCCIKILSPLQVLKNHHW